MWGDTVILRFLIGLVIGGAIVAARGEAQSVLEVPSQYSTVQDAVIAAVDGDKVRIAPGTYVGAVDISSKAIILEGAGPGLTTLQGAGGAVVSGEYLPSHTVIRGLRITGGSFAGMNFFSSYATIENCLIEGNASIFGGGGIYEDFSQLTIVDCVIRQNSSTSAGGGLQVDWGTVIGCTIEGNTAPHGAGVDVGDGTVFIDCLIANNVGTSSAVRIGGCSSKLENCTLTGNVGGIIDINGYPEVDVTNCIVWGNSPATPLNFNFAYSDVEGAGGGSNGNIDVNPLFVNSANGQFTLLPSSPCRNAGHPLSAPNPDGSIVDMGEIVGHLHLGGSANGNVDLVPTGVPTDHTALLVVGSSYQIGDEGHRVIRTAGIPFTIAVSDITGASNLNPFALVANIGSSNSADATFFPGIGEIAFSPNSGTTFIVADAFGSSSLAGPAFTPWSLTATVPVPAVCILQAIYWRSGASPRLRTTNAILLQVK